MTLEEKLVVLDIGKLPYDLGWRRQQEVLQRRMAGEIPDTLILAEHPPTITFGAGKSEWNRLKVDKSVLSEHGISFFDRTDRGGGAAFLGPGQIVGYPIMERRWPNILQYMMALEEVMIKTANDFNVKVERVDSRNPTTDRPYRATWYREKNGFGVLCTKGIGTKRKDSRFYTHHGFALNVNDVHSIPYTEFIDPCGFPADETKPISMQGILGSELDMGDVKRKLVARFGEVFGKKEVEYNGL